MYNNGNTSKNVSGASVVDGTLESADFADNTISGDKIDGGTISNFTSTGIDDNATGNQVTITDTGLGVGVASPDKLIEIKGDSGSDGTNTPTIKISDSSTEGTWSGSMAFGQIEFENLDAGGPGSGGVKASIVAKASTSSGTKSQLSLYTGNGTTLTEGLVIQNEGYVRPGTDNSYDLGTSSYGWKNAYIDGNLVIGTSGNGIDFSANTDDHDPTAGGEVLDDYEEGDWTPEYIGSTTNPDVTYQSTQGRYTKIGNMVYVQGHIGIASKTSSGTGNMSIGGLPFTVNSGQHSSLSVGYNNDWGNNNHPSHIYAVANTTRAQLLKFPADPQDELVVVDASGMLGGGNDNGLNFAGFYEVA